MDEVRPLSPDERGACEEILRSLPEWFGIEAAVASFLRDVHELPVLGIHHEGTLAGFLAIRRHFDGAAEIHVMGIRPHLHRRGLGRALVLGAEEWLAGQGVRWLQVKTLAPTVDHEPYARTRAFYESLGYEPLEIFPTLWGEANPCLLSVKRIAPAQRPS